MTEVATPQIGTDKVLALYAMMEKTNATADKIYSILPGIATAMADILSDRRTESQSLLEVLSLTQSLGADLNAMNERITELTVESKSHSIAHSAELAVARDINESVKATGLAVNEFTGWITPILDDFRETAILPTMTRIEGSVEALTELHNEIRTMVNGAVEQVQPLLSKLDKSPILRMLGVPSNG